MVIRLVAHSNALLHELLSALPVDVQSSPRPGQGMIFKDSAHVIEQPGDRQHHRGLVEIVSLLQEKLSMLISLDRGTAEPHHCLGLIPWKPLSRQAQLAQHVLGVLVSRLRRFGKPIRRSGGCLLYTSDQPQSMRP